MNLFKKFVVGIMVTAVFVTALSGCGTSQNEEKEVVESTVIEDSSISFGENIVTEVKERGLIFTISQEYINKGVELEPYNENVNGYSNIVIDYYSPTSLQLLDEIIDMDAEERTPEIADEYTHKIWATSRQLMEIVLIETEEYNKLIASGKSLEDFTIYSPAELLGTNDGYTYLISIPDLDNGDLNEAEIKEYQECKDYMKTVKENLSYIPLELENNETAIGEYAPSFEAVDLYENTVTSDIFAQKKLTVVNVWGTFCSPCIEEMPELADWSKEMSDDVQLIGLVGDINGKDDLEHLNLAKKIIEKSGADFINIIANDDFQDMLKGLVGYPTTFFVNQDGAIVGDPIVGADVEGYKAFVEAYLGE